MRKNLYLLFACMSLSAINAFSQTSFQAGQSLATGSQAKVVAVGDVNNDGLDDVVAGTGHDFGSNDNYKLFVFLQDSFGDLPTTITYSYPNIFAGLNTITIADVNNDSLNDVIIGFGDSIGIYFQNKTGTLEPIQRHFSGKSAYSIQTGDLNNDKLTDIAVSHWNESYIRIFYQTATGFKTSTYNKPNGGYEEIEVGDVTSDGLDDVIYMVGQGAGGIHVFKQNTSGTLNNYVSYYPSGTGFNSLGGIALGDFNNDGANDIVGTINKNAPDARLVIWYQDKTTKKLGTPIDITAYEIPGAIEAADLNCDGKPEIFTSHGGWEALSVFHQDNNGKYSNYDRYNLATVTHPMPHSISYGDINNDGKKDIVSVGYNNTIKLFYNTSIPAKFSRIDTVVALDSFYSKIKTHTSYFIEQEMDTAGHFKIIQTDSFKIVRQYAADSTRLDSMFTRYGQICGNNYKDSFTRSKKYYNEQLISWDTVFVSRTIDSVSLIGVDENVLSEKSILCYPNPTNGVFLLDLSKANLAGKTIHVMLFDNQGRRVYYDLITPTPIHKVDLGNYASGMYCLYLTAETFTYKQKIIRE